MSPALAPSQALGLFKFAALLTVNTASITLAIGGFALSQVAVADDERMPRELAWVKQISDQSQFLNLTQSECINTDTEIDNRAIKLGRIAFQSPRLLGGQAARMGLSCASCHPAGRRSEDFFIQQISSKPGNADVSHGFLSSKGGNSEFNPVRIPDLADRGAMQISNRNSKEFRDRLTQLIEVEFDGRTPTHTVFESLRYYLANSDTQFCTEPDARYAVDLDFDWQDLIDAIAVALDAIQARDHDTLKFVIGASRSRLEVIYRRYGAEPIATLDAELIKHSRALEKILIQETATDQTKQLERWLSSSQKLYKQLRKHQHTSWYNNAVVRSQTSSK